MAARGWCVKVDDGGIHRRRPGKACCRWEAGGRLLAVRYFVWSIFSFCSSSFCPSRESDGIGVVRFGSWAGCGWAARASDEGFSRRGQQRRPAGVRDYALLAQRLIRRWKEFRTGGGPVSGAGPIEADAVVGVETSRVGGALMRGLWPLRWCFACDRGLKDA